MLLSTIVATDDGAAHTNKRSFSKLMGGFGAHDPQLR